MKSSRHPAVDLGAAVVAVLAAWGVRLALTPVLGERVPFITFFPAMFAVAWWGGLRPTLWATALGVLVLAYFILQPRYSLAIEQPEYRIGLAIFTFVALAAGWLGENWHGAQRLAERARDHAVTQRERLRVTLASIGDAVIVTDDAGRITSLNAVAEQLTGWRQEEARGRLLGEAFCIVNERTRERVEDPCAKVLRTGAVVGLANHTLLVAKDGSVRPIDDSAAPILDDAGKICGVVLVFRDVTERRRSERDLAFLAEASSGLAALTDRTSSLDQAVRLATPYLADWCVVYTLDEHGAIGFHAHAHHDAALEKMLGEMLAKYPLDWASETASVRALRTGQTQFMAELPEALLANFAQSGEQAEMIARLGSRSVISVPLKIRERLLGVISFVSTDPARVYSEREVRLAENFAQRVATAVDNSQLYHEVADAGRQKDEFLAMLAHELRNPLAAIRYSVALGQMSPGEETGGLLEVIDRQAENLARLIDDLLDVSRISRDKITLRKEAVDAWVIVARAAAAARPLMEEKQHRFVTPAAGEPLVLYADPTRAEQILTNLLTNAAKYTPPGGEVRIDAAGEDGAAVIRVTDTGVGLPAEMLTRVFDLFTQADRSLDRSEGGLGIGLTVARRLAEMHGGSVAAASAGLGQGSQFTVRLPLADGAAAGTLQNVRRSTTSGGAPTRRRVLVVDDNRDTARSSAKLLELMGHEVRAAFDGPEALAAAREFQPEVMLLDIGLPGMTGYELVQRLRADGFGGATIVAVSGYGQAADKERSRGAGFDDHLVKPVDRETLASALERVRMDVGTDI